MGVSCNKHMGMFRTMMHTAAVGSEKVRATAERSKEKDTKEPKAKVSEKQK